MSHPRSSRLPRRPRISRLLAPLVALLMVLLAACGAPDSQSSSPATGDGAQPLRISSIPDQDQDKLAARDTAMARYLQSTLGVPVEYVPVSDYAASVTLFRSGDLDLVFYGGLTGVQARLQTPGAALIAQRDIDDDFRSVFVATRASGIEPFDDVAGLSALKGRRVTLGPQSSTSGRLMPEYFLRQAGVSTQDFAGEVGFSASHDATLSLVEAGSYEVGALNSQVWKARLAAGTVDQSAVQVVWTTPPYHDYHWVAGPGLDERYGAGFTQRITDAMLGLSTDVPEQASLLKQYGAGSFIRTDAANYTQIEQIARELGLLS
ncbi:putative selenate ABC transporter substrate-binding protein [Piscicoccus intestinalis]|uniref:putative selenate ABC transporter substrate-binding protein n=1 Tax=Piscicoccus intestinalis TaxID=746033 RepID=UPI000A58AD25|nr:putative selenate ABC transporter substrate-binding protein [Piscicoccus intestinalis]